MTRRRSATRPAARPAAAARPASAVAAAAAAISTARERTLVLGCGALVHELKAIIERHGLDHVDLECLPAKLHNRPALIADAARERIARLSAQGRSYRRILLGYADCGTAGAIDDLCAQLAADPGLSGPADSEAPEVLRVPGAHCYEFFATEQRFAELTETEPATFFLTDYLARHFELLVWTGLGIADHPELAELYFGNYRRLVLLTQTPDADHRARVVECAQDAAKRLGLPLEVVETGYGELVPALSGLADPKPRRQKISALR